MPTPAYTITIPKFIPRLVKQPKLKDLSCHKIQGFLVLGAAIVRQASVELILYK